MSANNFVFLAAAGLLRRPRGRTAAAKDFVVQAGSPTQSADGGPGYTVQGEVPTATEPYPIGDGRLGEDRQRARRNDRLAVLHRHRRRVAAARPTTP